MEDSDDGDQCDAVTSRIDFARISQSWNDAKHDAIIPSATASRLHFLSFPSLSPHLLHAAHPGRHVFEADKHAEASRKRPAPVLSLVRLFITRYMLALSATNSLWSFAVCPGLKCDVSPHLPARWSNIAFPLTTREFSATNQLFRCDFNRLQCSRFGWKFSRFLTTEWFFTDLSWHFL